jgi:hypothetical protein
VPSRRSRRDVLTLSAAALLSLAGCTSGDSPFGGFSTTELPSSCELTTAGGTTSPGRTTNAGTTATETPADPMEYRHVELAATPTTPSDIADEMVRQFSDLSDRQREVVAEAVANGSHLVPESGRSTEVFERVVFVAYEGDYYRVERSLRTPTVGYNTRYVAERVARSESGVRDVIARDAVIRPVGTDLSPDALALLRSLLAHGHREWENPIPDRVDALLSYLRENDRFREWDRFFLAYCGDYYELRATEAMA